MTPFGVLLRALRLARVEPQVRSNAAVQWYVTAPLSENEAALRSGVDTALIHRYEADPANAHPRRATVEKIAQGLELDDLETARLLVSAGYWPFPALDDDATDLALGVLFAIGRGDYRLATDETAERTAQLG